MIYIYNIYFVRHVVRKIVVALSILVLRCLGCSTFGRSKPFKNAGDAPFVVLLPNDKIPQNFSDNPAWSEHNQKW